MTEKPLSSKVIKVKTIVIEGNDGLTAECKAKTSYEVILSKNVASAVEKEWKLIMSLFKSFIKLDEDVIKSFIVQRDEIFGSFNE